MNKNVFRDILNNLFEEISHERVGKFLHGIKVFSRRMLRIIGRVGGYAIAITRS